MQDEKKNPLGHGEGQLYNPYADLNIDLNSNAMNSLYRIPNSPEFLFTEEANVNRRSFGDNLTYVTGCGYLVGATAGGAIGFVEGVRLQEPGDSLKLRLNRVLNSSGHRGRAIGNSLGVMGLLYSGIEGGSAHFRGTDDIGNSIIGGLGTGLLYKAAAGPRTAMIAGAMGGFVAAGLVAARQVSKRYLPI